MINLFNNFIETIDQNKSKTGRYIKLPILTAKSWHKEEEE